MNVQVQSQEDAPPSTAGPFDCPVRWDDDKDEPYIPFRAPRYDGELRLTPWRDEDRSDIVKIWNDPAIGKWAYLRPYPYTLAHCDYQLVLHRPVLQRTIDLLRQLHLSSPSGIPSALAPAQIPAYPFGAVRDPSGRVVGITDLFVSGFPPDQVERYDMPPERTRWEVAYDMLPEMQGRGIVGASVQAALGWCRWIGIPRLHAVIEVVNGPSQAVVKKNGFTFIKSGPKQWPAEKGGGDREVGEWVWTHPSFDTTKSAAT